MCNNELFRYVGDLSQVFSAKEYRLVGGMKDNMRACDVNNGDGLMFTVLPDRCMDLANLSYKGVNFSFISKRAQAHPAYFQGPDSWLEAFQGGMLTTCGLRQVGPPCEVDGERFGMHGTASMLPADQFSVDADDKRITLKGVMHDAYLFAHNLVLTRRIEVEYEKNIIHITDVFKNRGHQLQGIMMLYHFNVGYPLLSEHARFYTNAAYLKAYDSTSKKYEKQRQEFNPPGEEEENQAFYYSADKLKECVAFAFNHELEMGIAIRSNPEELPNLVSWKSQTPGDYAMGIEPCNCWIEGRKKQAEEHGIKVIEPHSSVNHSLKLEVISKDNKDDYFKMVT